MYTGLTVIAKVSQVSQCDYFNGIECFQGHVAYKQRKKSLERNESFFLPFVVVVVVFCWSKRLSLKYDEKCLGKWLNIKTTIMKKKLETKSKGRRV